MQIRKYVLDTNLYIGAIRDPAKEMALDTFLERNAPMMYMSAVVVQELRASAITGLRGGHELRPLLISKQSRRVGAHAVVEQLMPARAAEKQIRARVGE